MKKVRLVFIAILPGLIAACTTARYSAPVLDKTAGTKVVEGAKTPSIVAAVPVPPKVLESNAFYTVKKGDTLIQIALEFGQNYRDLIAWNNLANPNDLKIDQVLRVSSPEGTAVGGVQTGSVAITSGVEQRPLSTSASPPASIPTTYKTVPKGDKRSYSEGALTELQKSDTVALSAPVSSPKIVEHPKTQDTKSPEKAAEASIAIGDDDIVSWMWPAEGKVVAHFGEGKKGIDIAGKAGQPIFAAGNGKVLYAGSGIRGYGNLVIVKHTNNLLSAYAHNKAIFVKEDQTVNKGQKIAEMGNSDTDAVKLHFEIRQQGKPVDPSKFLPNR